MVFQNWPFIPGWADKPVLPQTIYKTVDTEVVKKNRVSLIPFLMVGVR